MKNDIFPHIFKCIHCKRSELTYTSNREELVCKNCNKRYSVLENVPIFLPESTESPGLKSEFHKSSGTTFNYIDHYQKDAYNSDYFEKRDPGTEHSELRVREYINSKISKNSGLILDVGCGKAWVAEMFCPMGKEVVSMDISFLNTSKALKVFPYQSHYAVVADAFNLPFKENTFDTIVASEIIEHVHDPASFISNLIAVLKPGGKLIVTTPYKEKLQFILCIHCNNPTPLHAHINSFDEKILKSLYLGDERVKWNYETFMNKIILHMRTHVILKYSPFWFWKLIDRLVNVAFNVPARILAVWEKKP